VWNATQCSPSHPDADPVGAPCSVEGHAASGIDTCAHGAMCWNVEPATNTGVCVAQCQGSVDDPTCAEGLDCAVFDVLALCLPACDPLADDCDEGITCRPNRASGTPPTGFVCLDVQPGGQIPDGCEDLGGCPSGQACSSHAIDGCGESCCVVFCDLRDDPATELCGGPCVPYFEGSRAPDGLEHVGSCIPA
jgi:hypothetical protein